MDNAHSIRSWPLTGAFLLALSTPDGLAQAPRVMRARWGATPGGDTVWQYTLVNRRGTTVRAITLGAIITNIVVRDRDGKLDDIVLGMPDVEGYLTNSPYFGAIAGRYANRIARGRFTLDGETYTLATNNGPNHLHGGIVGFDKRIWRGQAVQNDSGVGAQFSLTSADGDQGYPGEQSDGRKPHTAQLLQSRGREARQRPGPRAHDGKIADLNVGLLSSHCSVSA